MGVLGRAMLILVLGLLAYATLAGGWAALRKHRRLAESARNALLASFAVTALAATTLVVAFVRHDFSLAYVAAHASRELPLVYTLTGLWSGQAGSLLLWLLVLTGMGSAAVLTNRRLVSETLPWTVPVLAGIASFFSFVSVVIASPFDTQPAPADGAGMNASLQNPYMLGHPPLLYLGYVGPTIPFAFAMAALLSGRTDERWLIATRRWTLVAWTFLGIAILLGAKWAYETIGWGGYYAWDPVENAALMPWLASTAFLHSVMVQEKKGMLRVWNVSLLALAYQVANPPVYVLGRKPGTNVFRPISKEHPEDETFPGMLLLRLEGWVFFVNAELIAQKIRPLVAQTRPRVVALDLSSVSDLEYTALKMLTEAEKRNRERGILLWLVGLQPGVLAIVQRSPLGETLGRERMFFNLEQAIAKYQASLT